ncbi:hypothetical protein PQR05_03980 [Paraburkholderia sediminicola]|uniref:hypothetical protein n=1 Tax=Paraburkholderia sediminicola TaxID=458836 RepID=UPI0038BA0EBF
MWSALGSIEDPARFDQLEIDEVLFEQDSPKLFTAHTHGCSYLVYESVSDRAEQVTRYLAVCSNDALVSKLVEGDIPVLDALSQDTVWAIDQRFDGRIASTVTLSQGMHSVPVNCKPEPGVRLRADHHYS